MALFFFPSLVIASLCVRYVLANGLVVCVCVFFLPCHVFNT